VQLNIRAIQTGSMQAAGAEVLRDCVPCLRLLKCLYFRFLSRLNIYIYIYKQKRKTIKFNF